MEILRNSLNFFVCLALITLSTGHRRRLKNYKLRQVEQICGDGVCTFSEVFSRVAHYDSTNTWLLLEQYFCIYKDPNCGSQMCQVRLNDKDLLYSSCTSSTVGECIDSGKVAGIHDSYTYYWHQLTSVVHLSCIMDSATLPRLYNQTFQTFGCWDEWLTTYLLDDYNCRYKEHRCANDEFCKVKVSNTAQDVIVTTCEEKDESSEEEEPVTNPRGHSTFYPSENPKSTTTPTTNMYTTSYLDMTFTTSLYVYITESKFPPEGAANISSELEWIFIAVGISTYIIVIAVIILCLCRRRCNKSKSRRGPNRLGGIVVVVNRPSKPSKSLDKSYHKTSETTAKSSSSNKEMRYSRRPKSYKATPNASFRAEHVRSAAYVPSGPMSVKSHLPSRPRVPSLSSGAQSRNK